MKYMRLGKSGLKVTEMTFGTALTIGTERQDDKYAEELIGTAWNLGIRSFDTSNNYGMGEAEELLGKALKKFDRHEYVVFTKGSWPMGEGPYDGGLSRKHILWSLEKSLKRLDMNYVDVYFAHRYDTETPMEEVVRTFNGIIQSGKARYWATSEWPLEALEKCHEVCDELKMEKPILEQFIYSYAVRKVEFNGVMDFCKKNGVGMMGFSPLCQGFLTGKYRNGIPKGSRISKAEDLHYNKTINFYSQNKSSIDHFLAVCDQYEVAAALQWCLRKNVLPVFGASKIGQLLMNVEALSVTVPDIIWKRLE